MQKLPINLRIAFAFAMLLATSGCVFAGRPPQIPASILNRASDTGSSSEQAQPQDRSSIRGQSDLISGVSGAEAGNIGTYVGGGSTVQGHHPLALGSTGVFKMPTDWATVRAGVFGADKDGIGVGGVEGGFRLHTTNRLSPYAGLTSDLGFSSLHTGYRNWQTNPSRPYATNKAYGLASIAPEAGVSYWINNSTRVNAGASYVFAFDQPQFLVFGVSLDYVLGDSFLPSRQTVTQNNPPLRHDNLLKVASDSSEEKSSDADNSSHREKLDVAAQPNDENPNLK